MLVPSCPICKSSSFKQFRGRAEEQCTNCGSLGRLRAVFVVLEEMGLLDLSLKGSKRCLHLAPEVIASKFLSSCYGSGYYASDLKPSMYPHAQCLKLALPEDFKKIPKHYFDLIVHNHVLEHIPGSYKAHIDELYRILSNGGTMVCTFPDKHLRKGLISEEGGEHLASDLSRLQKFGHIGHYKFIGIDFLDYVKNKFSDVQLRFDPRVNESDKDNKILYNASGIVFVLHKAL